MTPLLALLIAGMWVASSVWAVTCFGLMMFAANCRWRRLYWLPDPFRDAIGVTLILTILLPAMFGGLALGWYWFVTTVAVPGWVS